MRRSVAVTLVLLGAIAVAGCGRAPLDGVWQGPGHVLRIQGSAYQIRYEEPGRVDAVRGTLTRGGSTVVMHVLEYRSGSEWQPIPGSDSSAIVERVRLVVSGDRMAITAADGGVRRYQRVPSER